MLITLTRAQCALYHITMKEQRRNYDCSFDVRKSHSSSQVNSLLKDTENRKFTITRIISKHKRYRKIDTHIYY